MCVGNREARLVQLELAAVSQVLGRQCIMFEDSVLLAVGTSTACVSS